MFCIGFAHFYLEPLKFNTIAIIFFSKPNTNFASKYGLQCYGSDTKGKKVQPFFFTIYEICDTGSITENQQINEENEAVIYDFAIFKPSQEN